MLSFCLDSLKYETVFVWFQEESLIEFELKERRCENGGCSICRSPHQCNCVASISNCDDIMIIIVLVWYSSFNLLEQFHTFDSSEFGFFYCSLFKFLLLFLSRIVFSGTFYEQFCSPSPSPALLKGLDNALNIIQCFDRVGPAGIGKIQVWLWSLN